MQPKIRVAPRNIQFIDNVQIKEIPRKSVDNAETIRRESWDPRLNEVKNRAFLRHKKKNINYCYCFFRMFLNRNQQNRKMLLL